MAWNFVVLIVVVSSLPDRFLILLNQKLISFIMKTYWTSQLEVLFPFSVMFEKFVYIVLIILCLALCLFIFYIPTYICSVMRLKKFHFEIERIWVGQWDTTTYPPLWLKFKGPTKQSVGEDVEELKLWSIADERIKMEWPLWERVCQFQIKLKIHLP